MGRALLSKHHSRSIPRTMFPYLIRKKFPREKAKVIITRDHSMIFYRYEHTPCPGEKQTLGFTWLDIPSRGARKGCPIGINRRKSPSTSVGARVVERRGEGLYGRSLGDCVARVAPIVWTNEAIGRLLHPF